MMDSFHTLEFVHPNTMQGGPEISQFLVHSEKYRIVDICLKILFFFFSFNVPFACSSVVHLSLIIIMRTNTGTFSLLHTPNYITTCISNLAKSSCKTLLQLKAVNKLKK